MARAQDSAPADPMAGMAHDMPGMEHGMTGMPGMDHGSAAGMVMNPPEVGMAGVSGSLGFYPFQREAFGTSWQPDASPRPGVRTNAGPWLFILGGDLAAGYARPGGVYGGQGGFVSGELTAMARRDLENADVVALRARVSPDTALGSVFAGPGDRQAPRAGVGELSASYSHRLDISDTAYAYGAVVGQPAFGAPLYFDRLSSGGSPLAPISAARPDALEAAAGVITGGWSHGDWKLEGSRFGGAAPRPDRLTTPGLDSWAARISVNPAHEWSLQASWADIKTKSPLAERSRWSVSATYTRPWGADGWWFTTALVQRGRAGAPGRDLDAWLVESAISPTSPWTLFARAEQADRLDLGAAGSVQTVRKLSVGAVHDWPAASHVNIGLGALYALGEAPPGLGTVYTGAPGGPAVFLRLSIR